jgi:ribonucleoside-diphosphate reductase alpha chain
VERVVYRPIRRKLKGLYEDGAPGEIFITMAKEGSTISGLMDAFATEVNFNLQYGVPLKFLVDKFAHVRFEPRGWTGNQQIPCAKSIKDYIFRWLGAKFLGAEYATGEAGESPNPRPTEPEAQQALPLTAAVADSPLCAECGSIMTRHGSCYKCGNCGGTSGCS